MLSNKATVLVLGGGGFIGSQLVRLLLEKGCLVKVIDRFLFGTSTLPEHLHLQLIHKDTRSLSKNDFDDVECVMDLAALSNDPCGTVFANQTVEINHIARARNAKLARDMGVKRYIMGSSCSA